MDAAPKENWAKTRRPSNGWWNKHQTLEGLTNFAAMFSTTIKTPCDFTQSWKKTSFYSNAKKMKEELWTENLVDFRRQSFCDKLEILLLKFGSSHAEIIRIIKSVIATVDRLLQVRKKILIEAYYNDCAKPKRVETRHL